MDTRQACVDSSPKMFTIDALLRQPFRDVAYEEERCRDMPTLCYRQSRFVDEWNIPGEPRLVNSPDTYSTRTIGSCESSSSTNSLVTSNTFSITTHDQGGFQCVCRNHRCQREVLTPQKEDQTGMDLSSTCEGRIIHVCTDRMQTGDAEMGSFAAHPPTLHPTDMCQAGRGDPTGLVQRVRCPKAGRSPRVPFTRAQVEGLEAKFKVTNYLSSREVTNLAASLNVTETRVKIWFQNRRARQRREAFLGEILRSTNTTRSMNSPCTSGVPPTATTAIAQNENGFAQGNMLADILETSPSTQATFNPATNYCPPVGCLLYPNDCLRTHEATGHGLGSYLSVNLDPTASVTATVP